MRSLLSTLKIYAALLRPGGDPFDEMIENLSVPVSDPDQFADSDTVRIIGILYTQGTVIIITSG